MEYERFKKEAEEVIDKKIKMLEDEYSFKALNDKIDFYYNDKRFQAVRFIEAIFNIEVYIIYTKMKKRGNTKIEIVFESIPDDTLGMTYETEMGQFSQEFKK